MKKENIKKEKDDANSEKKSCPHPYMKMGKMLGEKICTACGNKVYHTSNQLMRFIEKNLN